MTDYLLAFWNLENLFAPEDHPTRIEWIKKRVAADLKGWTPELYRRKLSQLARIIGMMKGGAGPDILGVCEVEDRSVLDDLTGLLNAALAGRRYGVVHADSEKDQRGIDTAFVYDEKLFRTQKKTTFSHFVVRRTGTRDILQTTFHTKAGNDLVVLCNHWPSRTGGTVESAGFRATAGETLGYWHERIREELGLRAAVLAFGDFNDDPFDPSLRFNANAWRERGDVERAESAQFFNLSWRYFHIAVTDHNGKARDLDGTLYFKGDANLFDQLLASQPLLDGKGPFAVLEETARIEAFPEMVSHLTGEGPIRFGLPKGDAAKNVDQNGFSDHFPVSVTVRETPPVA